MKKINSILYTNFEIFNNVYGEYIVTFCKKNNYSFYNKLKKLIINDVYSYFNFNINDTNMNEFVFEFIFSSLIGSYIYWYEHKDIIDLNLFLEFANTMIFNGVNIVLNKKSNS